MNESFTISLDGDIPVVAAAIHDGHRLSEDIARISALADSERFREEDPFTGRWTEISGNRIISHLSRFEFDLNRPPETAIYLVPSDAWGLQVWKYPPPAGILERTMVTYREFYRKIREGLARLVKRFGRIVIYDLHSYNYRRGGPAAPPDDPALNPEINIGTGTMNRDYWSPVVDRFMKDLRGFDFMGRTLDVRENIKFKGGYFPRWIHENFPSSCCCISIEVKKIFMDEWTGNPDKSMISGIGNALKATMPGVLNELSKQ